MKRRLAYVVSAVAVAVVITATPVGAEPGHPPRDPSWCGAENMRSSAPHMKEAMDDHTNENGDRGMVGAVGNAPC